jgi:hypothetical protein
VFDAQTGAKLADWAVSKEAVRAVAFSPDGKRLACGTGVPGQSGAVILVDTQTGKAVRTVKSHNDTVEAVAFKGNWLLAAADDERVSVTDVASGQAVGSPLAEHLGRCLSLAVPTKTSDADGGDIFATGGSDNAVKIWDARVRRVVVNFDQAQGPVWSLAPLNQPGRFVVGGGDGRIRFFGVRADGKGSGIAEGVPARTGFEYNIFQNAHENGVYAIAVAPNDAFIASGGGDSKLVLWNTGGGRRKTLSEALDDVVGVAISPDGKKVASASLDGKARIYDSEKGTLLFEVPADVKATGAISKASTGSTLLKSPTVAASATLATGTGLRVSWWNNPDMDGKPLLVGVSKEIGYIINADQPPVAGVPGENISARFEGFVEAPVTGAYVFSTRSDDGVRLRVNGSLVVDNWTDHGSTDDYAIRPIQLQAGQRVPIQLEFYQGVGGAEIHLFWAYPGCKYEPGQDRERIPQARLYSPATGTKGTSLAPSRPLATKPMAKGTGLRVQWWNNTAMNGAPILTKIDKDVAFLVDTNQVPAPGIPSSNISARWEGYVEAPVTGPYTFSTRSDDGVRLRINGTLVVDDWNGHPSTDNYVAQPILLEAGQRVPIQMEYFQDLGGAEIGIFWAYPGCKYEKGQQRQRIPHQYLYPSKTITDGIKAAMKL